MSLSLARCFVRSTPAAFLALLLAHGVQAQSGTVRGEVRDSLGNLLSKIEVGVLPTGPFAFTDERGRYTLRGVTPGSHRVIARRIGFTPELADIELGPTGGVVDADFALTRIPPMLAEQIISARRDRLPGVYARMEMHLGKALFSEDLERFRDMNFDNVLRFSPALQSQLFAPRGCGKPAFFLDGRLTPPKYWADGTIGDFVNVDDIAAVEAFKSPDFIRESFLGDDGAIAGNGGGNVGLNAEMRGSGSISVELPKAGSCQRVVLIWTKHYVTLRARAIER